ncbi:unnamed protein product, partial [marine sediment metagenome]
GDVVVETGSEVIRLVPHYKSFNIHPYYYKYIDFLSSASVDIFLPDLKLRFMIRFRH